jgi:hypothetical protein
MYANYNRHILAGNARRNLGVWLSEILELGTEKIPNPVSRIPPQLSLNKISRLSQEL